MIRKNSKQIKMHKDIIVSHESKKKIEIIGICLNKLESTNIIEFQATTQPYEKKKKKKQLSNHTRKNVHNTLSKKKKKLQRMHRPHFCIKNFISNHKT